MEIPKEIKKMFAKLLECYDEKDQCTLCFDCIANALTYAEDLRLHLPLKDHLDLSMRTKISNFKWMLKSTIDKELLKCGNGLDYAELSDLATLLLELSLDDRKHLRKLLNGQSQAMDVVNVSSLIDITPYSISSNFNLNRKNCANT